MGQAWQNASETLRGLDETGALERLGWTLVHSVWQVGAVAGALAMLLAILRWARFRYGLACGALVLAGVLPVLTWAGLAPAGVLVGVQGKAREMRAPGGSARTRLATGNGDDAAAVTERGTEGKGGGLGSVAALVPRGVDPGKWRQVALPGLTMLWLAGVVTLGLRQAGGYARLLWVRRWAREAVLAEGMAARVCARMGVRRHIRIAVTEAFSAPVVIGILRPMVLIPASVIAELSAAQLEAILLHELAHIRRHDYLVNLLALMLETLMFYHPAIWWIGSVIRTERENCCDDMAAAACGKVQVYAGALARVEELRAPASSRLALGVGGAALLPRIHRLLGVARAPRQARFAWAGLATACASVAIAGGLLLPASRAEAQAAGDRPARRTAAMALAKVVRESNVEEAIEPLPVSKITTADLEPDATQGDYLLRAGDALTVTVSDLQGNGTETNRNVRVSTDGTLSVPLVAAVRVAGLSAREAEAAIGKAYMDAQIGKLPVSLQVVEATGSTVTVLGNVQQPGTFSIVQQPFRLYDVMALSRGPSAMAGSDLVVIRREKSGGTRRMVVPIERLLNGDPQVDLVIKAGDRIYVPAKKTAPAVSAAEESAKQGNAIAAMTPAKAAGEEMEIERSLARKLPEMKFEGVSLEDFITTLEDIGNVHIRMDWRELRKVGLTESTPVRYVAKPGDSIGRVLRGVIALLDTDGRTILLLDEQKVIITAVASKPTTRP